MNKLLLGCCLAVMGVASLVGAATPAWSAESMNGLFWLEGVCETQAQDGTLTEYVYVPLFKDEMLSTMVAVKNGQPTRYELRVIKDQSGQVIFHEIGFKPDLTLAPPVPLRPLQSASTQEINFTDMKVTRTGQNSATMELTIRTPGTAPRTLTIQLRRTMKFSKVG